MKGRRGDEVCADDGDTRRLIADARRVTEGEAGGTLDFENLALESGGVVREPRRRADRESLGFTNINRSNLAIDGGTDRPISGQRAIERPTGGRTDGRTNRTGHTKSKNDQCEPIRPD